MANDTTDLAQLPCKQFKDGAWRAFEDTAAPEVAVTLTLDNDKKIQLWAFPHHLSDLALGHALTDHCPPGQTPDVTELSPREFAAHFSPAVIPESVPGPTSDSTPWSTPLTASDILHAAARFMELPGHFNTTGCFHRAALYDPSAHAFIHHTEDIGRHNCLDRLAGFALRQGLALSGFALFVTARATASLAAKAVRSGYGVMVSRSAVTTAAVQLARDAGMTLIGFSRENRFSVFTDPKHRVVCDAALVG